MSRIRLILIPLILLAHLAPAQRVMNRYADEALEISLSVKEKKSIEVQKQKSLEHAGKLFGPEINFITGYTVAGGGRKIELPVGFLLNDVYSTLNNLTGTQNFSLIENEEITFLPNNFYDARIRITQPILQPALKINKQMKQEEVQLAGLQTQQTKRDLIRDVKSGYLQWMQAREAVAIMDQGLGLLYENKRITEKLIQNGMAIPSSLMRIDAEIEQVRAQRQKAETDVANAARYFNFLLHRPGDSDIIADTIISLPSIPLSQDVMSREELAQLQSGKRLQVLAKDLEKKQLAPTLGVQLDAGSQAFVPDWGGYYLGGLQLEIPIWDNKKSKIKQQEWQAGADATAAQYEWTQQAFDVQLKTEIENLRSDLVLYDSYTLIRASHERYYNEALRRYKEGLTGFIELLDARTEVTQSELQQNLIKYQAWVRHVNIERMSATALISN